MKNWKYCKNYQNMTQRMKWAKCCWKNGTDRLAQCRGGHKTWNCEGKKKVVKHRKAKSYQRKLACVYIFTMCVCVCVRVCVCTRACSLSCVQLCDPMDESPPGSSVREFSSQEYWSGLPFPPSGDLSNPGIEPASPALAGGFFTEESSGKLIIFN